MIVFLRGLSGSGKSTFAQKEYEKSPTKTVIISRDQIRRELVGDDGKNGNLSKYFRGGMDRSLEDYVTKIEHRRLKEAAWDDQRLFNFEGNVIIDNLNLRKKYAAEYFNILASLEYPFSQIKVKDFDTPIEECVRRCAARDEFPITEDIIRSQSQIVNLGLWEPEDFKSAWDTKPSQEPPFYRPSFLVIPYTPNKQLPKAIICDLDGTLAHRTVIDTGAGFKMRSWYESKSQDVLTDECDPVVLTVIQSLADRGYEILFTSGRDETVRKYTVSWINKNLKPGTPWQLFMRDHTIDVHNSKSDPDDLVKYRLFNYYIRDKYNVLAVFDDRKRVLSLWETLGLKTFNVGKINEHF